MKSKVFILIFAAPLIFFLLGSSPARASIIYPFSSLDTNQTNQAWDDVGEAQLEMTVTDMGDDSVEFLFHNKGPLDSSICDVYFFDGTVLGDATTILIKDEPYDPSYYSGVNFTVNSSPPILPSLPEASYVYTADSDSPGVQINGVNPNEYLGFLFQGVDYDDVIAALSSTDLMVGLHVQAIYPYSGSESFVNTPVPIPSAVWIFGTGLIGLVGIRRKYTHRA